MDAIGINCHVNESRVAGGARGGGGREEGRPYPSNLLIGLGKCTPSLCLLPHPSLTKYSVSNSLSVMEGTSSCPLHIAIHVHGGDDMNLYV